MKYVSKDEILLWERLPHGTGGTTLTRIDGLVQSKQPSTCYGRCKLLISCMLYMCHLNREKDYNKNNTGIRSTSNDNFCNDV